jgi:hypothetical protein
MESSSLRNTIFKVTGAILRSLCVSLVMFMVAFTIVTGEFPPDFSKLKNLHQNLKMIESLQVSKLPTLANLTSSDSAENDVLSLENYNTQRAKIGANLFGASSASSPESWVTQDSQACISRVREVEFQLYKLQQRVAELEEKK